MVGVLGAEGIELRRKTGGGDEGEGGRGGRETAAQSAIRPPFFYFGFRLWMLPVFLSFFLSLSLLLGLGKKNLAGRLVFRDEPDGQLLFVFHDLRYPVI
jgi:hypothetical protein